MTPPDNLATGDYVELLETKLALYHRVDFESAMLGLTATLEFDLMILGEFAKELEEHHARRQIIQEAILQRLYVGSVFDSQKAKRIFGGLTIIVKCYEKPVLTFKPRAPGSSRATRIIREMH